MQSFSETSERSANLFGMDERSLAQWFESIGEKSFRGKQLFRWMYQRGITNFSEMTDLSKSLRDKLTQVARISLPEIVRKEEEHQDHGTTRKILLQLEDGLYIEAVYIPDDDRHTVCLSSQAGCGLGCVFCATGTMGFQRNLTTGEILGQFLRLRQISGADISNIVFMGMGEPLANYDAVMNACAILTHTEGAGIGRKKITISTAGLVPEIRRFTDEQRPYSLAVSLNATTDETRQQLMPIARKYTLNELMDALKKYNSIGRNRVTLEYVLIGGINDSPEDARRLIRMISQIGRCKVNVIPFNPVPHAELSPPSEDILDRFMKILSVIHSPLTLRQSRGTKISAACGQLAVRPSHAVSSHQ